MFEAVRLVVRGRSGAGGIVVVCAVFRPGSASAAGSTAVCVVSRPRSGSVTGSGRPRQIPSSDGFRGSEVALRRRFPSFDGFRNPLRLFRPPRPAHGAISVTRRLSRRLAGPSDDTGEETTVAALWQASDISAPTQDLTGVRCASAPWSGRVSVSSPVAHRSGQRKCRRIVLGSGPTTELTHTRARISSWGCRRGSLGWVGTTIPA